MENNGPVRTFLAACILLAFNITSCHGQQSANRDLDIVIGKDIKYPASLVLYKYDRQNRCDQSRNLLLIYNDKLSPCFSFVRTISNQDSQLIFNALNRASTYGGEQAACFTTDYALLVMNGKKIVGHISISLSCNSLVSTPAIKAQDYHRDREIGKLGFSPLGRKKLIELLKLGN